MPKGKLNMVIHSCEQGWKDYTGSQEHCRRASRDMEKNNVEKFYHTVICDNHMALTEDHQEYFFVKLLAQN